VEIVPAIDRLSPADRAVALRAFRLFEVDTGRLHPVEDEDAQPPSYLFSVRPGATDREVRAGLRVLRRLEQLERDDLPDPPGDPRKWIIWRLRCDGRSFDALARPRDLLPSGSDEDSRKQLAIRATKEIETFRTAVPAWYFAHCERVMLDRERTEEYRALVQVRRGRHGTGRSR
jgi:hypothetical protein